MSESMVERVARAIASDAYQTTRNRDSEWLRVMARAAIGAMREPTESMLSGLAEFAQPEGWLVEGWNAAIDAALAEPSALPADPSDCEDGAVTQQALDAALVERGQRRAGK